MKEKITLVKEDKVTPGQSWFVHLAGGHDAGKDCLSLPLCHAASPRASQQDITGRTASLPISPSLFCLNSCSRYTYALVFATDMYASVFKENPLDPARGRRYREKVLRPGGSQDDIDTLTVRLASSSMNVTCDRVLNEAPLIAGFLGTSA